MSRLVTYEAQSLFHVFCAFLVGKVIDVKRGCFDFDSSLCFLVMEGLGCSNDGVRTIGRCLCF